MTDIIVREPHPLTVRQGVAVFLATVDIKDPDDPYDGPALLFCRKSFGHGATAIFRMGDAWTVREPELFFDHVNVIADAIFVRAAQCDKHLIADLLHHCIDELVMHTDADTEKQDAADLQKQAEQSGLLIAINGETLVDAR